MDWLKGLFGKKLSKREKKTLKEMAEFEKGFDSKFAVDNATGEYLFDLVRENGVTNILELGTWRGASAIYLAAALPKDGILKTIDIGNDRVAQASENFNKAGLEKKIIQIVEDINEYLPNDKNKYDLIFMDAQKSDQEMQLRLLLQNNTHTGSIIVIDDVITMAEKMQPLFDFINKQKNQRKIVLGDFNQVPWSSRMKNFIEETKLRFSAQSDYYQATWPSFYIKPFQIKLDYIFHSRDFIPINVGVSSNLGSDHLGLVSEFVLRK